MAAKGRTSNGQFKKGQSGNPNGRPKKGEAWKDYIRNYASQKVPDSKPGITYREAIIKRLFAAAIGGDMAAMKLALAYDMGQPLQRTEVTGADGGPLETMTWQYDPDLDVERKRGTAKKKR